MTDEIKTIAQRLAEPFPSTDIEWRIGATNNKDNPTQGIALAYITNRAVQQRLDDVMGIAGWRNEFKEWRNVGVICGLSLYIDGEWITKWDGGDESDMEAIKGGFSDAMKRAAYQWGIGRYLYNLENVWVPVEKRGKSTVMKGSPPKLPDWALPESEKGQKKPPPTATQPESPKAESPKSSLPLPGKPAEKPSAADPITKETGVAILAERTKREGGWANIFPVLSDKGMPSITGKPAAEQKATVLEYMGKLTESEAQVLLAKLVALPAAPPKTKG